VLREFAIKGYVLDKQRMENGTFLGEDYFERLLSEIREIRLIVTVLSDRLWMDRLILLSFCMDRHLLIS